MPRSGADAICAALEAGGIRHVFGVPGTQTVALFEALRRADLTTVVPTSELAAAFAAVGYYRASGRPAAVVTIPGPGFTWALTGLAEARADSAAVIYIVGRAPAAEQRRHGLQQIDQQAIGASLVKAWMRVERPERLERVVSDACHLAPAGEPGPVVVEVSTDLLAMRGGDAAPARSAPVSDVPPDDVAAAVAAAAEARRPVLYAGAGVLDGTVLLADVVERFGIPVVTTLSGRGALPDDHPWVLPFDFVHHSVRDLNALIDGADALLAVGCKFTHNGTGGFALALPPEKLIVVNADRDTVAHQRARHAVVARAERFLTELGRARSHRSDWTLEDLGRWRARFRAGAGSEAHEPVIHAGSPTTPAAFFALLRDVLPRDAVVVTDSGRHQYLVRRHLPILAPRGLITPADYQSMGFGIPAALGAATAVPQRRVVAIVGDGGFAMTGLDLLTAARTGVPLTVIVLNDGGYGLIREQQLAAFGRTSGVDHPSPDFEGLAGALGAEYTRFDGDRAGLVQALSAQCSLVEVRMGDSWRVTLRGAAMRGRAAVREIPLLARFARLVLGWVRRRS